MSAMKNQIDRFAIVLFGIYLALYVGFVLITAFFPQVMQLRAVGRINLAVVYGLGLIVAAFVLAIIYGFRGTRPRSSSADQDPVPKNPVPSDPVPEDPVPKDAVPKDAVPKDAVPKDAVPKDAVPNEHAR